MTSEIQRKPRPLGGRCRTLPRDLPLSPRSTKKVGEPHCWWVPCLKLASSQRDYAGLPLLSLSNPRKVENPQPNHTHTHSSNRNERRRVQNSRGLISSGATSNCPHRMSNSQEAAHCSETHLCPPRDLKDLLPHFPPLKEGNGEFEIWRLVKRSFARDAHWAKP